MESETLDAVLADLRRRDALSPITRGQAEAYARATTEAERLTESVAGMEPGTSEHKRASTALRGVARERDTLARQLGLTYQARRKEKASPKPGVRLTDIFHAETEDEFERARVGAPEFLAELLARRLAAESVDSA